jgi:hypothetical protein
MTSILAAARTWTDSEPSRFEVKLSAGESKAIAKLYFGGLEIGPTTEKDPKHLYHFHAP